MRPVVVWITLRDPNVDLRADLVGRLLDDDHGAVVQVPDALAVFAAFLHQADRDLVAGRVRHPELRGQGVDLGDRDAERLGDLREVGVDRDERAAALARQTDERRVDVHDARLLDELELDRRAPSGAPRGRRGRGGRACAGAGRTSREIDCSSRRTPSCSSIVPATNPVATRSATRPSINALVSITCRSPRLATAARGFMPTRPKMSSYLAAPTRNPREPSTMYRKTSVGHAADGREEQERHHQQRADDQADDHAHDGAGQLGSGCATELVLDAGDRAKRETPEDATDHVADAGAEEDVQEGPAGRWARRRRRRARIRRSPAGR